MSLAMCGPENQVCPNSPRNDLEVTREMLEAGGSIVEAWDYDYPWLDVKTHWGLAERVYLAMRRLEPSKTHSERR